MSDFTVYRGKCSPEQLRKVLLMAMTIKDVKELDDAIQKAGFKTPRFADHIYFPANWCRGNSRINRVEFCDYEHVEILRRNGIAISPQIERFSVPRRIEDVTGVSFWKLKQIKKRSKSGNFFEAFRDINFSLMNERGDGLSITVTFDICVRERVCVTRWGLKLHSHWLDFLRTAGVKLEEVQE